MNKTREIKFRGKYLKTGEWVYGNLIVNNDGKYWIVGEMIESNEEYCIIEYWYPVVPVTVSQYTGLKDNRGQKIYTDDVTDCSYTNPMTGDLVKMLYVVESVKGYFKSQRIGGVPYDNFPLFLRDDKGVICGNIHDNPELLGVK